MSGETVIYQGLGWRVTSYGNGAAYLLEDVAQHKSIFFQYGDDAAVFRTEFDACDNAEEPDRAFSHFFSQYSELMQ